MTHPFHPLKGRKIKLVRRGVCWGEPRVYFYDDGTRLRSLPAAWTDIGPPDPVAAVSAGRSPFRVADLLELARIIREWNQKL